MKYPKAFVAGFASTLIFHQGLFAVFYLMGFLTKAPYSTAATLPFHVPQFISLAFWGGLWGIPLWWLIRGLSSGMYWFRAAAFGAVFPSLVAWFVVFPLKGLPVAGGWRPEILVASLLLNGAWGVGVALLMRIFTRKA
ncbi:MAG: hypothetical protein PHN75_07905 [Syntrophales bacterium]|nr:hypothetical protein [Syntrophales bacterium]